MRMSSRGIWLWVTFLVCLNPNWFSSEARQMDHPSEALLVGTVHCDTCSSKASHFISGASVAVECGESKKGHRFRKEAKTNHYGEFKMSLPFSFGKHNKKINGCSVKLIRSSEPYCAGAAAASSATSSSIRLKEMRQGKHIFSAGLLTFKPQLCNQKPPAADLPPATPIIQPVHKKSPEKLNKPERESQATDEQIAQPRTFPPIVDLPPNPLLPLLPPTSFPPPSSVFRPLFQSPPPSVQQPNPFLPSPAAFPTPVFPGVPPAATSFTRKKLP